MVAFILFPALFLFSKVCYAQQGSVSSENGNTPSKMSVFGEITVPLLISGIGFEIRFAPELQSADSMATKFCTSQATTLNIEEENIPSCVSTVGKHLLNQVNTWYSEKTFQTPLVLNGETLDVSFVPEFTSAESVAENICKENVQPSDHVDCLEKVLDFLRAQLAVFYNEKTLVIPLTVEGKTFDVSFMPERHSTLSIANRICSENAEAFNLTADGIPPCVEAVCEALDKSVTTWITSKTLDFNMSINDKLYHFSMLPERQTATKAARDFCLARNEDFGFTAENIAAECISPIANRITEIIQRWIASKEVTVRVELDNGETTNVTYMPDRQSSQTTATRFCVRNGASLGFTNETVLKGCIEPLAKTLREAAAKKQGQVSTDGTSTAAA